MRLLCATDLRPKSESALDRAGMLAGQLDAELVVAHVATNAESFSMLAEEIERARNKLLDRTTPPSWVHALTTPTVLVRAGSPRRTLIATARQLDADLVVLGTHRARPAWDTLAGSLAENLLRNLDCPVLIVRRMPLGSYRRILVALDWSAESIQVIQAAERIAIGETCDAAVVHSCRPSRTKEATERVLRLLETASEDPSRYGLIIESAPWAPGALTNVVRRLNPDLLVLGTRRRGRLQKALFGDTASRMLTTRTSDVLVVPFRDQGPARVNGTIHFNTRPRVTSEARLPA